MKRRKRMGYLVLGAVVAGMSLTGCTSTEQNNQPSAAAPTEVKNENVGNQPTEAPKKELEHVTLKWYVRGDDPISKVPQNTEAVYTKINELLKEKINTTLEMSFVPSGDYNQRMQMIMASGEEYDIAWTSVTNNPYLANVSRGGYVPLNDLLEQHLELKNLIPEAVWEGTKVDGKIYGVPNYQVLYNQAGFWFRKDLVEKYKLEDKIQAASSLEEMTEVFQVIKDHEPEVYPLAFGSPDAWFVEFQPRIENLFFVDTDTWRVYDRISEDKDFQNNYLMMREWYKKGFFPEDVGLGSNDSVLAKEGRLFARYSRMKPGTEAELEQSFGLEFITKETGTKVLSGNSVRSTMNAISITSKNPERALSLLELTSTDAELYNLLIFGLEGQDYTKIEENRIERKPDSYSFAAWMVGNQFNAFLLPGQPENVWEETRKGNEEADIDPLMLFTFDRSKVETEISQLTAVNNEFKAILDNGLDDFEKNLASRNERMKAAGMDKVIQEMQRQIDEWRAQQ